MYTKWSRSATTGPTNRIRSLKSNRTEPNRTKPNQTDLTIEIVVELAVG